MRLAELVMAVVMAIVSISLMVKSAELPIGWIPREGSGRWGVSILAVRRNAGMLHLDHRPMVQGVF